jgi:iron complex outermembrane recepter protein
MHSCMRVSAFHRWRSMAFGVGALLISLVLVPATFAADRLDRDIQFDIPAQPMSSALVQFAKQADLQLITASVDLGKLSSAGVAGKLATRRALEKVLEGSGLTYSLVGENTVAISTIQRARGGLPGSTTSTLAPNLDAHSDAESSGISEIIVTAQKRSERAQDVPIPVTALSAESLVNNNQLRLQDYYTSVPGLSVAPFSQSQQLLSIRGISTGFGNPTVGIVVDDVPYGSSTAAGVSYAVPDIDPGDLSRVEVLRGPQGTLYGASSMGGLIKFVTLDPSTEGVSGRVQAGTSSVYNGGQLGYNFRGSVNVPLSDTIAIRASAFTREDPGYIDNPVLHIKGINKEDVSGGRLSALWKPSEFLSLKLSALIQDSKGHGQNDVDKPVNGYTGPPLGDLQQNYLRGTGADDRKTQAYSATLDAKLGAFDLTSISGYSVNQFYDSADYSRLLGPGIPQQFFGVTGSPLTNDNKTNKFTQEIRLSAPIGTRADWLLGAFYTHESSQYVQSILASDPATGQVAGEGIAFNAPTTYEEYAGFTDVTLHLTDRFQIQFGGRESEIHQTFTETDTGPYVPIFDGVPSSPFVIPKTYVKSDAFTYLVTPQFKVSSDLMVYARLASGYRAGGPNTAPGVPPKYDPDRTQNYEIGVKGDFLEYRLSVDASLYYISWKDIQITLFSPEALGYFANGGGAKSQGVEVSVESKPVTGLTVAAWVAFDDAALTSDMQPGPFNPYGLTGNRLPFGSRLSGNLSFEQDFPVGNDVSGFVGGAMSYIGDREGFFGTGLAPAREDYPGYAKTDLRAGIKYDSWTTNLFVTNVADKRGLLYGGLGAFPAFAFQYIQPRTVGLSVSRSW